MIQRERHAATTLEATSAGEATTAEAEPARHYASLGAPAFSTGLAPGPTASERAYGTHVPDHDSPDQRIMDRLDEVDGEAIAVASQRYGIPEVEIRAIITQESRGVATANAGARQRDHGAHAASGLMQVTEASWRDAQRNHAELAGYAFASHRYDRKINILVGTAILADKRHALTRLGISPTSSNIAGLTTMAYNAGEGIVSEAYHLAVRGGAVHPDVECLHAAYLKPAIAKHPSVYGYYLTGGGKHKNPSRSVQTAIDLKFREISRYPDQVETLIADATEHTTADTGDDLPETGPRVETA